MKEMTIEEKKEFKLMAELSLTWLVIEVIFLLLGM